MLTEKQAKFLFFAWLPLLLPWLVVAPLLAMVYDAPPTLSIYIGTFAIWSYPLTVGIVWMFRKKNPAVARFPFMNVVVFTVALFVRP
jgi:hypothetical protein